MPNEIPKQTPEKETENSPKVLMQAVTFEDLRNIGIEAHLIAGLTEDDLISITHNILLHFNLDVFPYELKWQVHDLLDEREKDKE